MTAAVDTNILLDVLIPGEPSGESSRRLLEHYLAQGKLIISEVVYAELAAGFTSSEELECFLADTGIGLVCSGPRALFLSGERWSRYSKGRNRDRFACDACGHAFDVNCPQCASAQKKRRHVLADFLIGAHALVHSECLLSRDLGVYKTYFKDLRVVTSR